MTKHLIFVLVFLLPGIIFAKEGDKYSKFVLKPIYGHKEIDIRRGTVKKPPEIGDTIEVYYHTPKGLGVEGIGSFLEYQPQKYAIIGRYSTKDTVASANIKNCNFPDVSKPLDLSCTFELIALIDVEQKKVTRLNKSYMPEVSIRGLFYTGWKQAYDAYGCYLGDPFSAVDLDLDGSLELFFVGGVGAFGDDEGGQTIKTNLFIYKTTQNHQLLFKQELSYENFVTETDLLENDGITSRYQSFSYTEINNVGKLEEVPTAAGIRRYSKLYFKDFDKNDKLDILVWQREYKSRLKSNPIKGYKLEKVSFKLFEESSSGFIEKSIDDKTAKKYMEEYALTWRKGFPNKNLCSDKGPDDTPLIKNVPKQFIGPYNIYDPVLQK